MFRLRRTESSCGTIHDALLPLCNRERAVLGPVVLAFRRFDDKSSIETLARAQLFFADLVTDRTCNAILGHTLGVFCKGQEREHLALFSLLLRFVTRGRHMADRAFVLNIAFRLRMVDDFPTNAGLPIRVPRRIRHDTGAPVEAYRNILTAGRSELVMTR